MLPVPTSKTLIQSSDRTKMNWMTKHAMPLRSTGWSQHLKKQYMVTADFYSQLGSQHSVGFSISFSQHN
jgi:hypothetical protein